MGFAAERMKVTRPGSPRESTTAPAASTRAAWTRWRDSTIPPRTTATVSGSMAEERKRNELVAAVDAFRAASPEERTAMNAALTRREAGILDGMAQEAAEAAVRDGDPDRVRVGLDADRLFADEAETLSYEPVKERDYFSNAGARILRSYAGRPQRLKELDV